VASPIVISEEVSRALAARAPVVALETSVVAQGLPAPHGLEAARRCAAAVRGGGAVPAHVVVLGGRVLVGAGEEDLARLAGGGAAKAQARDLAPLVASGRDGATTVSATVAAAAQVGVSVVATGGIGGVHRSAPGDPPDVSADLLEIGRQRVCVVCAGPKAILDVAGTAEALETLGVPVIGWRTSELPAFYSDASAVALEHRVEDAAAAARLLRVHWDGLGRGGGVVLAVPPPDPIAREVIDAAVAAAVADARARGIGGKAVTPFLLDAVARATGGRSRAANLALLEQNARVAAEVAAALARPG
jgi:pseudouridine-5'-phosphate glycosidase